MTEEHAGVWTRTSRVIRARPAELYAAFMDPAALVAWLPPAEMPGEIHEFDARVGGGYRMSLFYPPDERVSRGKTSDREDMVNVRFVELTPSRRIVEAVSFVTTDPALFGEMTMTATFEAMTGGTEVTVLFEKLPPGLRAGDNDASARLSLEQLARRFECREGVGKGTPLRPLCFGEWAISVHRISHASDVVRLRLTASYGTSDPFLVLNILRILRPQLEFCATHQHVW